MQKGYEKTYDWVVKLLQDCNFEDAAKRLGLTQTAQDEVSVEFLGRVYRVNKNGVHLTEQNIVWTAKSEGFDYNLKSDLGYYVLSDANMEPINDFCTLSVFCGGVFREGGDGSVFGNALGRVYGRDYQRFCAVAEKLGMTLEESKPPLKYIWRYTMLPKLPIKIVYYEGDEEYPTKLQILYDKTAIQVYKFEPLAVLNGCFMEALAAIGEL
ncbi:hypothetical protein AGMMS49940_07190 [Spirochaetia bacterium]|nr:hypothetical protein AGMMS49940_07160 [Spirochaetia bacterium]GHV73417.1 hypothetical protein AGMMS49940_07190 [Spirochaetia bacterium]